ncbi:hypothetical protein MRX96_006251 [Rhipicephalus microplus]
MLERSTRLQVLTTELVVGSVGRRVSRMHTSTSAWFALPRRVICFFASCVYATPAGPYIKVLVLDYLYYIVGLVNIIGELLVVFQLYGLERVLIDCGPHAGQDAGEIPSNPLDIRHPNDTYADPQFAREYKRRLVAHGLIIRRHRKECGKSTDGAAVPGATVNNVGATGTFVVHTATATSNDRGADGIAK